MAINHETLRLAEHLRVIVGREVDETTRILVQSWARAWEQVNVEWQVAIAELVGMTSGGAWPSPRQVARATRAQQALQLTYSKVVRLAELAGVTVSTSARTVTTETAFWQARLIASQLPAGTDVASVAAGFNRVDPAAIDWIVDRTTQQVTALHKPLTDEMTEAMKRALVRGVAVGDNPRKVADDMLRQVQRQFNGGLTRALVIARTEMLDAHRAAAHAQQAANTDVLAGWYWQAKLDTRTCPSCWAQHGHVHDLAELGPLDHQQGRCTRLPKLKSWEDLGIGGLDDEPDDEITDARAVFDAMSHDDQVAVMGPKRLRALQQGQITWEDLSLLRPSSDWRDSYGVAPIGDKGNGGPSHPQPEPFTPLGTPVSAALAVSGGTKVFRDHMQHALDIIDSVHGDGVLPLTPLKFSTAKSFRGEYTPFSFGKYGRMIKVTGASDHPSMTAVHEIGHFLDHKGLGDGGIRWGTSHPDDLMRAVLDAGDASSAIRSVRNADVMELARAALPDASDAAVRRYALKLRDNAKYLVDRGEMWARIYAQWIAIRSGDGLLLEQIATEIERTAGLGLVRQWADDDFAAIAAAVDALMKARGWLTTTS